MSDVPITRRLAEWIVELRASDIPERVRDKARYQVLNVLAALHAGSRTPAGQAVHRAVAGWDKPGPCTVIPTGERFSAHEAVLVNSAFSMALDYDDYLYMGHTGHSAVLASLALCEALGRSTEDLLVAQVIANEIGGRVGASCVFGPQNGQAWSFIHAIAGAAVASRLYGLTVEQTAHALSIALYQPPFTLWPGFMGPQSKVLTAAWPTVAGIQAAQFAREGLTGAPRIFEDPRKGFWASFSYVPLPHLMSGFGQAWVTDTLTYKRYPGCAYVGTTLDALFEIREACAQATGAPLDPDQVERVEVEASLLSVEMDSISREHVQPEEPLSPINVNFSIPYNVAIALLAGRHTAAELSPEFLAEHEEPIRALAERTTLRHDWRMTFEVVAAFDTVLGKSSVAAVLGPRDLVTLARGYRNQLGGDRRSLDLSSLFTHLPELLERGRRALGRRGRGTPDLGEVDFSAFRMAFPARVTVHTTDGRAFSARQDVPFGAPGQRRRFETVEEKYRTEAEALGEDRVENGIAMVKRLEEVDVAALVAAVCA
ncbi:MAG: MmgE/PrpD family protein [Deltaproteobacteria bacterium]|nr:MmgE/PrpD family protein [Deltaproteobacteria bacterium]